VAFLRTMEKKAMREKKYAPRVSQLKKCSILSGRMHRWINLDSAPIWLQCFLLSRMRRIKSAWKHMRCERQTIEYEKRGNHDPDRALKVVEKMNERAALGR
jgi:hypothetical protein